MRHRTTCLATSLGQLVHLRPTAFKIARWQICRESLCETQETAIGTFIQVWQH